MKKTNARRIIAFVLALMLALPVVSIPAMAEGVTQSTTSTTTPVKAPSALFIQDFEAFYTLSGPIIPGSGVLKGPSSARVIQSPDGNGNVLQIECKAGAPDGKYWLNYNYTGAQINNNFIEIMNVVTKKLFHHPSGELGENVSGFNGNGSLQPTIYPTYGELIVGGTVTMPSEVVYAIRGIVNEDDRTLTCKLYYIDQYENKYEFEYEYEYEYEVAYDYAYEYEYAYETEMVYDKNGNLVVKKDENGNVVYVLDDYGYKIPILDKDGNYTYALDENGNKIRKKDANGNDVVLVDENGEMVINRYVYEYDADGNVKLDSNNNPIIATDAKGNKLTSPDGEGDLVVLLDKNGDPIPLYYPDGTKVPKLDAEGNKVIKTNPDGTPVYSNQPRLDSFGYPVPKGGVKNYILDKNGKTEVLLDENGEKMLLEIPLTAVHYRDMNIETFGEWRVELDENGNPVMIDSMQPVLDAAGNPVLDENGEPVMDYVWQDKYFDVLDENGDPVMVEVETTYEDENGQMITVKEWVKKRETRTETQLDENGNPVIKKYLGNSVMLKKDKFGDVILFESNTSNVPLYLATEWSEEVDGVTVYYTDETKTHYSYDPAGKKQPMRGVSVKYEWLQKRDADGNLLYDKYGHPIMYSKEIIDESNTNAPLREVFEEEYQVKIREHAQEEKKFWYEWTVETPNPILTQVFAVDSQVRDSFGGYSNIAQPAYLQTGTLSDDVLLFSTDYYFSADDPATPDINEAISHGFDVRISVNDKNGVKKDFDFIHADTPKDGSIVLKAHNDAPMTVLSGEVTVPLGSWCNIMIAADFNAATYAVYVNGELICMKQNTVLAETTLKRDVVINTQTAATIKKLDRNGNFIMVPQKDENGNIIMIPRRDENGNFITSKKLDENGNYIYDRDGNHVLDYEMVPAMVPDIERWPDGTPKYTYLDTTPTANSILMVERDADGNIVYDENGNPVQKPVETMDLLVDVVDKNGNYKTEFVTDKDGKVIMTQKLDENGNIYEDEYGDVVWTPMMKIVQENVTQVKRIQKVDILGNLVFETKLVEERDENGNIVYVEQKDKDGNTVYDDNGKPIMVPNMVYELDENGEPKQYPVMETVQEEYKVFTSTAAEWNTIADSLINGTWNLGHFVRGGAPNTYTGYMHIDNVAVYAAKDIEQFFAYKGYSIDFVDSFSDYAVGDKIPFVKGTTTVNAGTAVEKDGDKVLEVNLANSANAGASYTPAHKGFSYLSSQKVVLEGNYFLPTGAVGKINSQFNAIGAFVKSEGAFGHNHLNDLKTREYAAVDLYTIESKDGRNATLTFNTANGPVTAKVPMNKWAVISAVIDLETGKIDIYVNGILGISAQLGKKLSYTNADKTEATNVWTDFCNISVGADNWTALSISNVSGAKSSLYVGDLTVTTMGVGAELKNIPGLISADVYANGDKVATVTDTTVFYTSKKVTLENVKTYDLGTDQLLKTDDTTIRFTVPAGIRFSSLLDLDALNALYDKVYLPQKPSDPVSNGKEDALRAISFGTLIIPTDLLKGKDLTFETLEAYDLPYLDVQGHEGSYYDLDGKEGTTHIVGSIIDIKEENIDRLFSAVNYVRIILESGLVYNVYSDRVVITSAQSMADDAYGEYTSAEQEVLDAYFAGKKPVTDGYYKG